MRGIDVDTGIMKINPGRSCDKLLINLSEKLAQFYHGMEVPRKIDVHDNRTKLPEFGRTLECEEGRGQRIYRPAV